MNKSRRNKSAIWYDRSIPLQAQHPIRAMPLWWKSSGAPAHHPQSNYPGRRVRRKARCTASPRVSIQMFLQRKCLTKGKNLIQNAIKDWFVSVLVTDLKQVFALQQGVFQGHACIGYFSGVCCGIRQVADLEKMYLKV